MRTIEQIKKDLEIDELTGLFLYTSGAPTAELEKSVLVQIGLLKELIAAQDAEIARLKQQLEWQPIETAPINTWILVLDKQPSPLSGPVSAYQSLRRIVDKKYEWITDGDLEIEPTHWMPIPPLPQAQEELENKS